MRIGIDLGGTKTEVICLDRNNGKELYRHRVPSPRDDYQKTIENIQHLVEEAENTLGQKGTVGIGIPGTISAVTGLVKNANSTWLNNHPLDKDVGALLDREVRTQNDANCFAVSEAVDGAGAGKKIVFGIIIGTGSGAGVVIDGKPLSGLNGIGGEWGHNVLPMPRVFSKQPDKLDKIFDHDGRFTEVKQAGVRFFTDDLATNEYPGPECYCGKRGCIETWVSGTGFKNDYQRVTGENLSTHDVIANMREGEPKAVAAFNRYVDRMARALSGVMNVIDPDVVVLGGGMSNINELYTEIPKVWNKYIFSDTVETKIVPPRHGDSSGVRGAAWLWNDE
ncbi:MAG: ROK family protein [Pseudomonadota bacterium]